MNFLSLRFAKNLIIAGIIVIAISLILLLPFRNYFSAEPVDNELIGQFGDFIGGIAGSFWALAGVIMFYVALHEQRKDFETNREILSAQLDEFKSQQLELAETREVFKEQSETQRIQRFETSFFNMISSLSELVQSFKIAEGNPLMRSYKEFQGLEVFKKIHERILSMGNSSLKNKASRSNFEDLFKSDIRDQISQDYEICFPYFKMIEQIVFLIHDSGLGKERLRYINILKAHLDPYQFAVLGHFIISTDLEIGEFLSKIKPLKLYDVSSFECMKNLPISLEILQNTIKNGTWKMS